VSIVSHRLWVRGSASLWARLKRLYRPLTPAAALLVVLALVGAAATGGYISWEPYTIGAGYASATPQSAPVSKDGWGAERLIRR